MTSHIRSLYLALIALIAAVALVACVSPTDLRNATGEVRDDVGDFLETNAAAQLELAAAFDRLATARDPLELEAAEREASAAMAAQAAALDELVNSIQDTLETLSDRAVSIEGSQDVAGDWLWAILGAVLGGPAAVGGVAAMNRAREKGGDAT